MAPQLPFGILSLALLCGIAPGFAMADIIARVNGSDALGPFYVTQSLTAMAIGGGIGLAVGWILDATVVNLEMRRKLVGWMWAGLWIGVAFYACICPAFQMAR